MKLWLCGSCGFELFLNAAAAVAALIVDERDRLLIVVRGEEPGKGMWDLPGGFADPGEPVENTLRREVAEELSLEIVSARFLCSQPNAYEYMGVCYPTLDLAFICEVADLGVIALNKEIEEVVFVPPRDVELDRFAFQSTAKIVACYRETFS